jgi:hypothetical protein
MTEKFKVICDTPICWDAISTVEVMFFQGFTGEGVRVTPVKTPHTYSWESGDHRISLIHDPQTEKRYIISDNERLIQRLDDELEAEASYIRWQRAGEPPEPPVWNPTSPMSL